jgi:hypothetical protein
VILRRILGHLERQHWTALGLDLVIVVLGVFIGMQVSNWNQQRIENQQAVIFTRNLIADLREEHWGYQLLIAYNGEVLKHAEMAAKALEGTATLADEAFLVSAYRATQYKQRLRRRSTYDELISTGNIGLIRDQMLRETAMRLYNSPTIENLVREGMQSRYREAFRMSLPNDVQRALSRNCGDRYIRTGDLAAIRGNLDYPCETGLSPEQIAESAASLRSNPTLLPLLRLRIADIETRLFDLTSNNRAILENLNAIGAGEGQP